jgi:UPF0716 protein FxsA
VFARLFLLLTLLPVVEIVLLVWVADRTSVLFVLAAVLATGILGAWLARRQGLQTLRRISSDLEQGRMPADSLVDGLLVLVAGVLLIIPGFLTDIAAIALLFPPSRRLLKRSLARRFRVRMVSARETGMGPDRDRIIDVKVIESPPPQTPR